MHLKPKLNRCRVLCFPGYNGLELDNVYSKVNIPLDNIVGIERKAEIARHISETRPGIHVEHMDMLDYLSGTKQKFDIISLDFTGFLTDRERAMLTLIGERDILENGGVLLTNFQAKREPRELQKEYKDQTLNFDYRSIIRGVQGACFDSGKGVFKGYASVSAEEFNQMPESERDKGVFIYDGEEVVIYPRKIDNTEMRDICIPLDVIGALQKPFGQHLKHSKLLWRFLDFIPPDEIPLWLNQKIQLFHPDAHKVFQTYWDHTDPQRVDFPDFEEPPEKKKACLEQHADKLFLDQLFKAFANGAFYWSEAFSHLAMASEARIYFPTCIEMYKYVSDTKDPRICDFYKLEHSDNVLLPLAKYIEGFFRMPPLLWWIYEDLNKSDHQQVRKLRDLFLKLMVNPSAARKDPVVPKMLETFLHEVHFLNRSLYGEVSRLIEGKITRTNLGSFYKPKAEAAKDEVIRRLISGANDEEIHQKFRIEKTELAGYKAALARGAYDHLKPELDRDTAIVLLKRGESEDSILRMYNVNPRTLAAYKAHITMGTYDVPTSETLAEKLLATEESTLTPDFENDVIRVLIRDEAKYSQAADMMILPAYEFSFILANANIHTSEKMRIRNKLATIRDGRPLNRNLDDTLESVQKLTGFLATLLSSIKSGIIPSDAEIDRAYRHNFA